MADIIAWFIMLLSLVKIVDITVFSILWDLRYGKKYSDHFHLYLKQDDLSIHDIIKRIGTYGHSPMRVVKAIGALKPKLLFKPVANYLYRWPTLMLSLSAISLTGLQKFTAMSLLLVLIALSVIEVFHQLVSRLTLGVADNINKYAYVDVVDSSDPEEQVWHTSRILRDSMVTLLVQLFCFIFSYASMFWILERYYHVFKSGNIKMYLDAVYFSLVTATTVGFSDITPIGRLVSMLEFCSVWLLVVLIFAHYLATLSVKLDDNANKRL